jgi:hypothetical protein
MFRLLRNVRKALKHWQDLPAVERDRYKDHVGRIRSLVAELGGKQAVGYVDGSSNSQDDIRGVTLASRPRAEVMVDLQIETTSLLTALAVPATTLAKDSLPRSARLGGKIASKGLRSAAQRYRR